MSGIDKAVRAAVVGAGSWGTAIATLLHRNGHQVALWTFEEEVAASIRREGENRVYLPGIPISSDIRVSHRLEDVVPGATVVVSVSPAQHVGRVMAQAAPHLSPDALVVSASKGIETDSLRTMEEVLAPLLPTERAGGLVILSGPSFAIEVAQGQPTAVVAASRAPEAMLKIRDVFRSPSFRVYTNPDVVGVELGGAVKNVVALAAGVLAGLELGYNTQAALLTRGLAEMSRLGSAMGADPATFAGLAGLGDLVLTCTGPLSRNRSVGVRLGRGEVLDDILREMRSVAEGVRTAPAVRALAHRHGVDMPIVEQVCGILQRGRSPADAVRELMLRDPKAEA